MLIDWFTVIAQAINFLVLVWLMKRFLYKPILKAIDDREKLVAKRLADAKETEQAAQQEKAAFAKKNQDFDQQRADLVSKATQDAQATGKHLLEDAKKAAAALGLKQQEDLKEDEVRLHQDIVLRLQKEVFSVARKVLVDLADKNLDTLIVENFIKKICALKDKKNDACKEQLKSAFNSTNGINLSGFTLRSSSELPPDQKTSILTTIQEVFGFSKGESNNPSTKIQFQTSRELIGGIELNIQGQKIAWSISDYLKSLEQGVADETSRKP